jgi:hypothetical protein
VTDKKPEPTTEQLVANASLTRRHVARDVERLAEALQPTRLMHRAIGHAEHSLERWAADTLQRLGQSARRLASYARSHPVVSATVVVGATAVVWRLSVARRR